MVVTPWLLGIAFCLLFTNHVESIRQVKITAATLFSGRTVFFFAGDEVLATSGSLQFQNASLKELFNVSADINMKAVYMPLKARTIIFYGDRYGIFMSSFNNVMKQRRFKYGPARRFIRNGGPDGVTRRGDTVYVFKGCDMAIRYKWNKWGRPQDVTSLGLPCDIDAAYTYPSPEGEEVGTTAILKGAQLWFWKQNNTVEGPVPFHSIYERDQWEVVEE